jgi:5'-nucleotidase
MKILLTNDDGIYAPGLAALKREAEGIGEVAVVAPESERSAAAHSITLDRPLRVREVYVGDQFFGHSVDGSPADCVKIGVKQVMGERPDLVISGINPGANVGINVLYSGTVAAALEGAILGITAIAVSQEAVRKPDFTATAALAFKVIGQILANEPPPGGLFNVNIPACAPDEIRGVAVTPMSTVSYEDGFDLRTDPRGGTYYWMTGEMYEERLPPESDMAKLHAGFITVTPLQYDLTDRRSLETVAGWDMQIESD